MGIGKHSNPLGRARATIKPSREGGRIWLHVRQRATNDRSQEAVVPLIQPWGYEVRVVMNTVDGALGA